MKRKILLFALTLFLLFTNGFIVEAKENNWILDESNVLSKETMEYVENLNKDTFSTYKNKPQLGLIIIDNLPQGYTMDQYKLEKFNELGVGTKAENCGLLFVFAINDREYGLEIGEGYERGSSVRYALETDFVDSDIKQLLRDEKYDKATMQIVEHLENIMANEEAGIYTQSDIRKDETASFAALLMLGTLGLGLLVIFCYKITKRLRIEIIVRKTIKENPKLLSFIERDETIIVKDIISEVLNCDSSDIQYTAYRYLYGVYINESQSKLSEIGKKERLDLYDTELRKVNTFETFLSGILSSYEKIVYTVDKRENEKIRIFELNKKRINKYVDENLSKIDLTRVNEYALRRKMEEMCVIEIEFDEKMISEIFDDSHNDLVFDYEYEKFVKDNNSKLDCHFNKNNFKSEIRSNDQFSAYVKSGYKNNTWMIPLLITHMQNNKRRYERRQRSYRSNSSISRNSFGRSFGGGFSRGGGFSGRW